jgi:Na+/proline symporter
MSQTFPVGLTGLVIAAIVAASLSSVDSALNSTTSIIVVDFYNRLWLDRKRLASNASLSEQRRQILVSRIVNAALGVTVIVVAASIDQMGEIYTVANKILGAFFGALLGTFVLGMFSSRARGAGVLLGALAGLTTSCFLSFFSGLTGLHAICQSLFGDYFVKFCSGISWQWPPVFGILVTLLVGWIASRLMPAPTDDGEPLTYWEVMRMKTPT